MAIPTWERGKEAADGPWTFLGFLGNRPRKRLDTGGPRPGRRSAGADVPGCRPLSWCLGLDKYTQPVRASTMWGQRQSILQSPKPICPSVQGKRDGVRLVSGTVPRPEIRCRGKASARSTSASGWVRLHLPVWLLGGSSESIGRPSSHLASHNVVNVRKAA